MKRTKTSKPRVDSFGIPPHANARAHAAFMKRMAKMTPHEIFQTMVEAGVYTKSGKLTKRYASQSDDSEAAAPA